jgi:anti-sigma-K factor RskA
MSEHDVFDAALPAYALDALDAIERRAFEAHLAGCDRCQRELGEWRRVAVAIGGSIDPVEPPASLKTRTMMRATSQLRAQAESPASSVTPIRAARPGENASAARARARWPVLAAVAALVTIVVLGAYAAALRTQVGALKSAVADASASADALRTEVLALRRDSVRLVRTLSVLSAPDVIRVDLRGQLGAPSASGRAYLSRSRGLIFAANQLPALTRDQVYQLWVIPSDSPTPISAGVFSVDAAGSAVISVTVPAGAAATKAIAVSLERGPDGSADGPKGAILLVGASS